MPFCAQCKSLAYPQDGKVVCRKCGWTSGGPVVSKVVRASEASGKKRQVLDNTSDVRQQQTITCPKCGHDRAYFHLMQTRRSDEPPTQINECVLCKHSWREY
ncbi:MAG TPA: transcription factor S [Candidatus Thermoplasmatota archaeon]|nr:transcription factor S [Candidatus Thermoplasmatota archaeon]